MGIPYYFSYLIQNYSKILKKLEDIHNIDNLYIDSNSIIYDSINFENFENKNQFEKLIINSVLTKLEYIINIINPTKNIIIAFDGVPPFAKVSQQKNRRYKSWIQSKILNKSILWDTCSITPGTEFMNKLNNEIKTKFNKKTNIILSLSDQPGEGEHKIYQYIRNNDHINDNILIYGMDADLFMLSLNHLKYCKNIYLYRETPQFIKSLNIDLDPNQNYIINIYDLGLQIYKELCKDVFDEKNHTLFYNKIEDYIFICFLLGNDFMPHFSSINIRLNGFTSLLELYKNIFNNEKFLCSNGEIIWSNFRKYIKMLGENEHTFIKQIYNIRDKQSKKFYPENTDKEKEFKFIATPSYERNIEKFINPYENCWEYRYYYSLFDIDIDIDKIITGKICINYLQTLQWTYYYYSRDCINWSHHYKYHYPPLLVDLYKHIPYFGSELVLKEDMHILHPHLLLSYVLPKNSLNLLPLNIHNYLLKNYENHYKENYEFIYAFCKYFWEGHVKFPHIDNIKFQNDINIMINI
jgi:5'-3' exonuclease